MAEQQTFRPAQVSPHQIDRVRLVDLVRDAAQAPLTLLRAPAGYGKSTVLRQTTARFAKEGAKIVWVNCDTQAREPENLIASLHQALIAADASFAGSHSSFTSIIKHMEACDNTVVIVFDDHETLYNSKSDDAIGWLATVLPANCRIMIGTRIINEAVFAKLLLEGTAKIINAGTLAFNANETTALLQPYCHSDTIERIVKVAEGWPVIIQLARIKAEQEDGDLKLLQSIIRPHSEVFGYLATEVFSALSPDQSDLLTKCSIVDHINPEISAILTGNDRAYAILADLTALEPLISIQKTSELTVKLHPALREFLRSSLAQTGLAAIARLHGLAARYYSSVNEPWQAIHHAIAAHDPSLAADIVEEIGGPLTILSHGPANAWSYLSAIPRPMIEQRPALTVMRLTKSLVDGDGLLARQLNASLTFPPGAINHSPMTTEELVQYSNYVICLFEDCRNPVNHTMDDTDKVEMIMRRRASEDPRALGLYLPMRFFLEYRYGSIHKASEILAEYEAVCNLEHYAANLPSISPHFGMVAYARGDAAQATHFFSMNLAHHWDRFVGREEMLIKVGNSLLAKLLYDQDRIEDSIANISAIGDVFEATFMELFEARDITLAYCHMQRNGIERALEHIDHASRLRELYGLNRLVPALGAVRVNLLLQAGRPAEAQAVFIEQDLLSIWAGEKDFYYWNWIFIEAFLRAYGPLYIALDKLPEAIQTLEVIKQKADTFGRQMIVSLCNIYLAVACAGTDDQQQALDLACEALTVHAQCDVVRPWLDLSGKTLPLLQLVRQNNPDDVISDHILKISELWKQNIDSSAFQRLLTPRESDVLVELAKGFPTKIIARNLSISPETVKHHLKSIFAKLGVENRKDAISEIYRRTLAS